MPRRPRRRPWIGRRTFQKMLDRQMVRVRMHGAISPSFARRKSMLPRPSCPALLAGICAAVFLALTPAARCGDVPSIDKEINDGQKAWFENRIEDALRHFSKADELIRQMKSKNDERLFVHEAYWWLEQQPPSPDRALIAIDKALAKNPSSAEALYQRGRVNAPKANSPQQIQRVVQDLRQALKQKDSYKNPVNKNWAFSAAYELWNSLLGPPPGGLGQFKLAAEQFEELSKEEPTNTQYLFYLGLAYFHLKDDHRAAAAFRRELELKPAA